MKKLRKYIFTAAFAACVCLASVAFAGALTARQTNSNDGAAKKPKLKSTSSAAPTRRAKTKVKAAKKMGQTKTTVAPGEWGASGAALSITESGAQIQYDCAHGEITEKLTIDADGNFAANGTHTPHTPGPTRVGREPQSQPARYEGKISGKTMILKVVLSESNTLVGEFTFEEGRTVRLHRCL